MRLLLHSAPFLPALGLLAALSTKPDTFLGPLQFWLSAVAACLLLLPLTLWVARRSPALRIASPSRYARFVIGTLALSIYLSTTFWPLRLRVLLSEPFLRLRVTALLQSQNDLRPTPFRTGLFRFDRYGVGRGTVAFDLGACGFFTSCSLAYSNSGPPPPAPGLVTDHLYGPWWHLTYGPD